MSETQKLSPQIAEALLNAPTTEEHDFCTIREYLHKLLYTLWDEGEGFSGKRPFGDSGWTYDLYTALVKVGAVRGYFDEYGYIEHIDEAAANKIIFDLIDYVFKIKE